MQDQTPNGNDLILEDTLNNEPTEAFASSAVPPNKGPGYPLFVGLLILVVFLGAGLGFVYNSFSNRVSDLEKALQTMEEKSATQLNQAVGTVNEQLTALDAQDQALRTAELPKRDKEIKALREEVLELKTHLTKELADLDTLTKDRLKTLETRLLELDDKLAQATVEWTTKQDEFVTTVSGIKKDSDYIIEELGKKAEKAYMKFMERKLRKKITAVSEDVKTVKGDLETRIAQTERKVDEVAEGLTKKVESTVKKQVKEHNTSGFEPSVQDKNVEENE